MKELGGGGWRVEGGGGSQPLCSLCFTGGGGGGGGAGPDPEASLTVKLASFHLPTSPHPSLSHSTPPPHLSVFISASLPPSSSSSSSPQPPTLPTPSSSAAATLLPLLPHLLHPHCSTRMFFLFLLTHQEQEPLPRTPPCFPFASLCSARLAIMFSLSPWKQIQVGCPL